LNSLNAADDESIKGGKLKKVFLVAILLALSAVSFAEEEINGGNVLYTENVEANKGSSFPVSVSLRNIDTLVAIQVPIYYRSENVNLVCDSIAFVDTRLGEQPLSFSKIEPVGKVAFFAFMAMSQLDESKPMLNPGDGPIATLWFTAAGDIKAGVVTLDSGPHAYYPHEWIDYSYHFWVLQEGVESTLEVDCAYKPSTITVK
jgi:hypothetical protein